MWSVVGHLRSLVGVVSPALGCYAACNEVGGGVDYRYPFVADRIAGGPRRVLQGPSEGR